jgi:protocatechuate 3,4-dioxygenase beta subunit
MVRIFDGVTEAMVTAILSDDGGEFAYGNLAPGYYIAIASAPGFSSEFGGFTIVSGETVRYSFALEPSPGTVDGTVVNAANNEPLPGTSINLRQFNLFGPVLSAILSDINGSFHLGDLPPSNYVVIASRESFISDQTAVAVSPGQASIVNLLLQPTPVSIEGRVTDSTGSPAQNAPVLIVDENGGIIGEGITDSEGEYNVPGVTEGNQTVIVNNQDQTGSEFIQPDPGTNRLDVTVMSGPGSISGTVIDNVGSQIVPGAILSILESESRNIVQNVISDGRGAYRFSGLIPGDYTVTASAPQFGSVAQAARNTRQLPATAVIIELSAAFGTLTGTVRDSSGNPLFKALVVILSGEGLLVRSTITNRQGRYTLTNLAAGVLNAQFSYPGKQTAVRNPIIYNEQTTVLDVVLFDEEEE